MASCARLSRLTADGAGRDRTGLKGLTPRRAGDQGLGRTHDPLARHAVVGLRLAVACDAGAEPITLDGSDFQRRAGRGPLQRGWGSGSLDDLFVLVEEIRRRSGDPHRARHDASLRCNRIRSHHEIGFALTKLVRNGTAQAWSLFNLELREFFDHPSSFGDGLSSRRRATPGGRSFRTASPIISRRASPSTACSSSTAWSSRARPCRPTSW